MSTVSFAERAIMLRLIPPGVDMSDAAVLAISRRLTRISNATFFASQEFNEAPRQIKVAA
jgi:hypothetical protein